MEDRNTFIEWMCHGDDPLGGRKPCHRQENGGGQKEGKRGGLFHRGSHGFIQYAAGQRTAAGSVPGIGRGKHAPGAGMSSQMVGRTAGP